MIDKKLVFHFVVLCWDWSVCLSVTHPDSDMCICISPLPIPTRICISPLPIPTRTDLLGGWHPFILCLCTSSTGLANNLENYFMLSNKTMMQVHLRDDNEDIFHEEIFDIKKTNDELQIHMPSFTWPLQQICMP